MVKGTVALLALLVAVKVRIDRPLVRFGLENEPETPGGKANPPRYTIPQPYDFTARLIVALPSTMV
jgi:hypothetical protein